MVGEVATTQTFEEKMKARVKDSVGDLITDEELSKIVSRAMEEIFFNETMIKDSWGHTKKVIPPLSHQMIEDLLNKRVYAEVSAWMSQHADELEKMVRDIVSKGIGAAVIGAIQSKFQTDFASFECDLIQRIQNGAL